MEKIVYEDFKNMKNKLKKIPKENTQAFKEYLKLQTELLSYDLSDIPFSAWKDIKLYASPENILDFSHTYANIDFKIFPYTIYANYEGCNIRNLESLNSLLDSKQFSLKVQEANPKCFVSSSFPWDILNKLMQKEFTMEDYNLLTSAQKKELETKNFLNSFTENTQVVINYLGFTKAYELYLNNPNDYKIIRDLLLIINKKLKKINSSLVNNYTKLLKEKNISEIKDIVFSFMKDIILYDTHDIIDICEYPSEFILKNQTLFLLKKNIPEDLRQRYYRKDLTVDDIINNIQIFKNIPISCFTKIYDFVRLANIFGSYELSLLIEAYPEMFNYIIKSNLTHKIYDYALKRGNFTFKNKQDLKTELQEFLKPFFLVNNKLGTGKREELLSYEPSLFPLDSSQEKVTSLFGLDNIKRFEKETGFFSLNNNSNLEMFNAFAYYFTFHDSYLFWKLKNKIKDNLSYEEFLNVLAYSLDIMKKNSLFQIYPDYDFVKGNFRNNHPEIFMDEKAPVKLKQAYYSNKITPEFLFKHEEYISFLKDKNLNNTINADLKLISYDNNKEKETDFILEYSARYGKEKLLKLMVKYGDILWGLKINNFDREIEDEERIEKALRKAMYDKIITNKIDYSYLKDIPEFREEYPEIFLDLQDITNIPNEEKLRIEKDFYNHNLAFTDLRKYPLLKDILKFKNLHLAFGKKEKNKNNYFTLRTGQDALVSDLELLDIYGQEVFLDLLTCYGKYFEGITNLLYKEIDITKQKLSYEDLKKEIEKIIFREIKNGNMAYHPSDAPTFLKEKYPRFFLAKDAPLELQKYYYSDPNSYLLTFDILHNHEEYLSFLKGKDVLTPLLRGTHYKKEMIKYFNLFGEEKALKLGVSKPETVMEMISNNEVELMKSWYDKTGQKFIPDVVVMQNFNIKDADKFLTSATSWSKLMHLKSFAQNMEARDAMLKLAYAFGVFDNSPKGLSKVMDLLKGLPRKIDICYSQVIETIDKTINSYSNKGTYFNLDSEKAYEDMLSYLKENTFIDTIDSYTLYELLKVLKEEKVPIDYTKDLFKQIYGKEEDGYYLTFNPQLYPKTSDIIRNILERYWEIPIVSPLKAHQLCGGFILEYNPDFRDFFLQNLSIILDNPVYVNLTSSIQRNFKDIKTFNSNRALTFPLAVSYVEQNRFSLVEPGNERLAEVCAIAGYSQADFEVLQKIYNYGKLRTYSSIPNLNGNLLKEKRKYTYEMVRLDDPLPLVIGTLTNCCQKLNDIAEGCMEHSMVSSHGRLFVVRDEEGNIVAQSWVWRNKDILCFDNIEVPHKAFERFKKNYPNLRQQTLADEIFKVYQKAAEELLEIDKKEYFNLLEQGKISNEEYEGLRLGKITVGIGCNDIALAIQRNAKIDKSAVARPLPYEEPVKLTRGLYLRDSTVQYILTERKDYKKYNGDTLLLYNDDFKEYNDSNFTTKDLLFLVKLEVITKKVPGKMAFLANNIIDKTNLVTQIAKEYGISSLNVNIAMNPNLAIIYEIEDDKINIIDLLYNSNINVKYSLEDILKIISLQLGIGLKQISKGRDINIDYLDEEQKDMCIKAMNEPYAEVKDNFARVKR